MRMTVHNKLHSRKGASLTFALLAFLVCAVIGTVVVAAGVTAAGRVSGMAEADQRYYAVTSAAQLFRDALEGKEFTVERIQEITFTEVYNYDIKGSGSGSGGTDETGDGDSEPAPAEGEGSEDDTPETEPPAVETYERIVKTLASATTSIKYTLSVQADGEESPTVIAQTYDGETADSADGSSAAAIASFKNQSLLNDALITYLYGGNMGTQSAYFAVPGSFADKESDPWVAGKTLNLSFTGSALPDGLDDASLNAILNVEAVATLRKDGAITITFCNKPANPDDTDIYQLELTMIAKVSGNSTVPESVQNVQSEVTGSSAPYTETTTTVTTNTKTTTITWSVGDINMSEVKKVGE